MYLKIMCKEKLFLGSSRFNIKILVIAIILMLLFANYSLNYIPIQGKYIKNRLLNLVVSAVSGRITLKAVGEPLEGYTYAAFSGGCIFAGKELYAFRAASGHFTTENHYGTILFYERVNNVFKKVNISLVYDTEQYGELRDPNLSASKDGTRLYVSCFTSFNKQKSSPHHSIIFVLDRNLKQIGSVVIPESIFWGNTVETPEGYLLHADYSNFKVNIFKSSAPVTSSNLNSIKMLKVTTLPKQKEADGLTDYQYAEPTIGYYQDKLICLVRTGRNRNSSYSYTYNLEGDSKWAKLESMSYIIHAPCIKPYSNEKYLIYSGSIINESITGGSLKKRMPYIGLIHIYNGKVEHLNGRLVDNKYIWGDNGYGGYTTLVKIDDAHFGIMYYNDTSKNKTLNEGLYFKLIDVNELYAKY